MKIVTLVATLLLLSPVPALADELERATEEVASIPLESVEAFEDDIVECLKDDEQPEECFEKFMLNRFPPGNHQLNDVVKQLGAFFHNWLAGEKVFNVHMVKEHRLGDYYRQRVYFIEDTSASVIMFDTSFVNSLGKWYLLKFNLSSKKESIRDVVGVDL